MTTLSPATHLEPDTRHFAQSIQRLTLAGAAPIALMGAGSYVKKLAPLSFAPPGAILGIIDDDPAKLGKLWAGLEVLDIPAALRKGAKGVLITAFGTPFDQLWAKRAPLREAGLYILSSPPAFDTKGWDDCLIEQYEYSLGKAAGLNLLYNRQYPPESPKAWDWLLKPLLDHAPPASTILEVGSGAGLWTQHLIDRAKTYHAVDYSPRLLFEVIEHRFARHISKLRLHHDQLALLPNVPDASVDLAFSFDVFVHFKPDLVLQYLQSLKRILKPSGSILLHFVDWNPRALDIYREKFSPSLRGQGDEMHYNSLHQLQTSADALDLNVQQLGPTVGWAFLAKFTLKP